MQLTSFHLNILDLIQNDEKKKWKWKYDPNHNLSPTLQ